MEKIIRHTDFSTLKSAYREVRRFLESITNSTVANLHTRIESDLGFIGDDIEILLEEFILKYDLKLDGFEFDHHFTVRNSWEELAEFASDLITLPINSSMMLLKLMGCKNTRLEPIVLYEKRRQNPVDLTLAICLFGISMASMF